MATNTERRVLIVGPSPPPYAGVEVMTRNLVSSTRLLTNWSVVYCNTSRQTTVSRMGKFSASNAFQTLRAWLRYLWLLLQVRPHLVHLPLSQNPSGFMRDCLFVLTAKALNCSVLLHFHGGAFDRFYVRSGRFVQKLIRLTLGRVECLIVLADRIGGQFDGLVPKQRIRCIPNCIDVDASLPPLRRGKRPLLVLFLGKISVAKGAVDFVKAAAQVLGRHLNNDLTFKLVGDYLDVERNITFVDNPHRVREQLGQILSDQQVEGVTFVPAVDGTLIWKEYAAADVFVLPSHSEGFPMTILEAMLMELPIIATDVGALPEILIGEQALFVVPVGKPHLLVERIERLAGDPELRARLGSANRRHVEELYGLATFARSLQQAYDDVWEQNATRHLRGRTFKSRSE